MKKKPKVINTNNEDITNKHDEYKNRMTSDRTKEQIEREIRDFKGCGKKLDLNGDCWYISSRGNLKLCKNCKKKRDLLIKELNEKEK